MHHIVRLAGPLALASVIALGSTVHAQAQARRTAAAALVHTTAAQILVDGRSRTLYVFAPDQKNRSVCSGQCAVAWPPVIVPHGTTVPATLPGLQGTFGATVRTGGQRQLTYDGAPLYTFVNDRTPGQMTGQGLVAFGGYWWVVVAPRT